MIMTKTTRGRNEEILKKLEKLSPRVITVQITGDHDSQVAALAKYGKADAYLDLSPPAAVGSTHMKTAIVSLRKGGRASLMGGTMGDMVFPTGHIVFNDIELKGQWMYQPSDISDMIKLVETGVLDLNQIKVTHFGLEQWEEALDTAAQMKFDEMAVFSPC